MKSAVIYQSKTGFSKLIAEQIAEKLSCEAIPLRNAYAIDFTDYESLVLVSPVYAGMISAKGDFEKLCAPYPDKKTALCTVGMTELNDFEYFTKLDEQNLSQSPLNGKVKVFHFCGGMDYQTLGFLKKGVMSMIIKQTDAKENKTPRDIKIVSAKSKKIDFFDENDFTELLQYIG